MSSSRKKRSGGCSEDLPQNSSRPAISKNKKVEDKATVSPVEYKGRLRPRPTRQTERYKSPILIKRGLFLKSSSPPQGSNTNSEPSTSKAVKRPHPEKVPAEQPSSPTPKTFKTLSESSSTRKGKGKALETAKKLTKSKHSPKKVVSKVKKLAESKATTSSNHPTKSNIIRSRISANKFSPKLEAGDKAATSRKPRKAIHSHRSTGSKSTNSKTGSCSSSNRRGSVRSHTFNANRSTGAGSHPSSEPDHFHTTNTILMRTSKQPSEESTSRKRAANDSEGRAGHSNDESSKTVVGATAAVSSTNDSESDDSDVSRLQALLEARGLPPRLFSNLGPRMQQVLHRSMGTNSKVQQHLQGIQAVGDESQQLQSAIELCQMLVMGNEDTLAGFPIKSAVPALTTLLKMEHNFDLMNHACRALTYMMEALPHSSSVIIDAIPTLLEKLQTIQCIDVAEQSLTALDILSRRHASAVLAAGGVSASLEYIDFFSLPAQRSALSIAANCCYAVGTIDTDISGPEEEFNKFMKASLPLLSSRLSHHDKKCVETTCLCFVRLIDSFQQDSTVLNDIADVDLLKNFQKLIVEPSSLLSSSMLVLVIHSMTVLCSKLRKHASQLLEDDITETLHYLLCGRPSDDKSEAAELLPRGSQETQEIASFIVQLLPRLPKDDPIFCIDSGSPTNGVVSKTIVWQWSDSAGHWHSYKRHESRILEMAYGRGETEIDLHTGDRSVTISFDAMRLIDDNTGMHQPVQRILSTNNEDVPDESVNDVKSDTKQLPNFVRVLLPVVMELYNSSAGFPPVRHVCLHALQRMVFYSSPTILSSVLEKLPLSSQISSMLSNQDTTVVVSAVQLADLLMRKLPGIYKDMFVREGVVHRIKNLSEMVLPDEKDMSSPGTSRGSAKSTRKSTTSKSNTYALREHRSSTKLRPRDQRGSSSSGKSSKMTKLASSFLSTMNPTNWRKSISSALSPKDEPVFVDRSSHSRSSDKSRHLSKNDQATLTADQAKSAETDKWLKRQATEFLEKHFKESQNAIDGKPDILQRLTETATSLSNSSEDAEDSLKSLCEILDDVEVSPFELIQSGTISALLNYLTTTEEMETMERMKLLDGRIRVFLSVSASLTVNPNEPITGQIINSIKSLPNLVRKLNQCFGRMEQFPVKSRELMSEGVSIYHALTSRQLKCQLQRHPDCNVARRWLGGAIKIDPLIQMRAIERYLIVKGYGSAGGSIKQRLSASLLFHDHGEHDDNVDDDDDDDSDNDEIEEMGLEGSEDFPDDDDSLEADNIRDSQSSRGKQRVDNATYCIEFYIGNNKIPRQMTIYQALQQYATPHRIRGSPVDSQLPPSGSLLNNSSFWAKVHILQYKLVKQDPDRDSESRPPSKSSSKRSQSSRKMKDQTRNPVWFDGITPITCNPLHKFLTTELPKDFGPITDPSVEVLTLLRILHAISRYWQYLYTPNLIQTNRPLVVPSAFVNSEVNAKCMHQLEDPLVIITGQLSPWVQQIGKACPFLLSFETRQLLFKVTAFERNRALQYLHDSGITRTFSAHLGLSSSSGSNSRNPSSNPFAPRIDKKKCSVSRKNLLQQAEKIMSDHASSQAMIEVDYENEVGTGLGPTLEFFTLTSKEFQNAKLRLWREELTSDDKSLSDEKGSVDISNSQQEIELVKTVAGLFPKPLAHSAKHSQVTRCVSKFKFLGKFLGKALLDGRLVDIPLSVACYRWLLGEEASLTGMDLDYVDPGLASTFRKFCLVAHKREKILEETPSEIESLEMDGCSIEDLGLDMCLPGYASVELMKGGKSLPVTAHNLDKYLYLLAHWTLCEGVKHQMNALKEGFQSVIPLTSLSYFFPEELDLLFCGSRYRPWDVQELSDTCRPDHGYTQDSEAVKILYKVLSSYDASEQRNFLQFVTGCPHLPFGGLRSLNPPLTVVRKTCENSENPDDYLPSVMTCLNYLKLPEYSSEEVMRRKLNVAVLEGQKSFLLS